MKRKHRYPGEDEAQKARGMNHSKLPQDDEPDFMPGTPITPNYKKFEKAGYSTEEVLAMLNID